MKSLLSVIEKATALARFRLPSSPILPWPAFSLASYGITARLVSEGIVPRTVIDVGANAGQFSISCMKWFARPRVVAFEPVPEAFRKLLVSTSGFPEITTHNVAIGERDGYAEFHVTADLQSSSILNQTEKLADSFPDAAVTGTIQVEVKTLETAMRGLIPDGPVLLKLDVQGYEVKVIEGAGSFLDKVDYVVAETSFAALYEGEGTFMCLVGALADRGFDFRKPVGVLVSPVTGAFLQMDALFCRRPQD